MRKENDLRECIKDSELMVCHLDNMSLSIEVDGITLKRIIWDKVNTIKMELKGLDLLWIFEGDFGELVLPVGIKNEEQLLSFVQVQFKKFDNEKLIEAMTSLNSGEFNLWKR